jgi:isoquinoline 1-oxidoreductase alpha subunit
LVLFFKKERLPCFLILTNVNLVPTKRGIQVAYQLTVNGQTHQVQADEGTPLLWVLREQLGLTGTKFGCGIAACGACTVHLDGAATRSCSVPIESVGAQHITTIEGLAPLATPHPIQQAWIAAQIPQCGYCQSGMIMAVAALLAHTPAPTDEQIDTELTNICRCGTYPRIRSAIHQLAQAGATNHG